MTLMVNVTSRKLSANEVAIDVVRMRIIQVHGFNMFKSKAPSPCIIKIPTLKFVDYGLKDMCGRLSQTLGFCKKTVKNNQICRRTRVSSHAQRVFFTQELLRAEDMCTFCGPATKVREETRHAI